MKCPKCGYLGFEHVERCRNCGYDFPVTEIRGVPELPLRGPGADSVGLLDLALSNPSTGSGSEVPRAPFTPELGRVFREPGSTPGDLPLFGSAAADARPLGMGPLPARPPLAVRRATPEVPRVRIDQPRAPMLDLGPTDPEPLAAPAPRSAGQAPIVVAEPASLTARVVAGIIDLMILAAVDGLVIYFTLQICGLTIDELSLLPKGPLLAFLFVQNGGYLVAFTAGGQTLGKMAAGIKVVPEAGAARMDLAHSAMRTLVWALLAIPAGLGFLTALFNDDHRGLHDRCAGTRVVRVGAA